MSIEINCLFTLYTYILFTVYRVSILKAFFADVLQFLPQTDR